MQLKHMHTQNSCKSLLYIKREHTNTLCNAWIHTELVVNIYMQHIHAIPISI
jgi:hypothetical protein